MSDSMKIEWSAIEFTEKKLLYPERSPRKLGKVETSRGPHSARSIFDDIDAEVGIINK